MTVNSNYFAETVKRHLNLTKFQPQKLRFFPARLMANFINNFTAVLPFIVFVFSISDALYNLTVTSYIKT